VVVRFADRHLRREERPSRLTSAFSFDPPVTGAAEWIDGRTLAYYPTSPLTVGGQYQCIVNVAAVVPAAQATSPFAFQVTAVPNRIEALTASFESPRDGDLRDVVYSGVIEFAASVAFDDVKGHITLREDGKHVPLSWEAGSGGARFSFRSDKIQRGAHVREFELWVEATPFGLEADFVKGVELLPVTELGVAGVEVHDQEDPPRLGVQFTEPLLETRDYSGHVVLDPYLEAKIVASGRTLLVFADFRRGVPYKLTVKSGTASRWDAALQEDYTTEVTFGDLWPRVTFSQSGAFLPSEQNHTIGFRTLNVRRVTVNVMEVFESNLGQFLQDHDLGSSKERRKLYGPLNRVGVTVASDTLEIGTTRNQWVQSTLGLSRLLEGHGRGLFLVTLAFHKDDTLFECDETVQYRWDHPCGRGYYYHGVAAKPVIVTDIGLLAKLDGDRLMVAATHLGTAKPLSGVKVTLFSYQNQPIETRSTNRNGVAVFDSAGGFYLDARWKGQRAALKFSESKLELSGFDVGGVAGTARATRAFVYTDRGVYRPGETVRLAAIVRDQTGSFPSGHPIRLKLHDPRNRVTYDEVNKEGDQGHYVFEFDTAPDDPTGNWHAVLYSGKSLLARHTVKVETVVPHRLKVRFELPKEQLGPGDRALPVGLRSTYLFGAPASGLQASVHVRYTSGEKQFDGYEDYTFAVPGRAIRLEDQRLYRGVLGDGGTATFQWDLPDLSAAPSVVYAVLTGRVQERGGRPVTEMHPVLIDVYQEYVGVKAPSSRYVRLNEPLPLTAVVLDRDGDPQPGRELQVNVYHSTRYWWWQYDSRDDFRLKFKTDAYTELLMSFTATSGKQPVALEFTPGKQGQLLVEVQDVAGGHTAGFFVTASSWAEGAPLVAGTQLEMQTDRETYRVGDEATVSIRTPPDGVALVSVEKGGQVLSHEWIRLEDTATGFRFRVTEDMLPNAYVHAVAIQPHAQTVNDRPLRLFGVLPIRVEEETTRLPVEVGVPSVLKPREEFEVSVEVPAGREATVTVAVVDEGLLGLTSFETPDPWGFFFAKERLSVVTYDTYDDVIGALWGDIHKSFEIGGGEELFRKKRLAPEKARRFEPVAMFHGPVRIGPDGRARVAFTMPHYVGAVRVMVVAASGDSYGHAEKTVQVKEPLLLLPTLPRVAGPGESFVVPVTVFALEEDIGDVTVSIDARGLLSVVGPAERAVTFSGKGEQEVFFELSVREATGLGTVRVAAESERSSTWAQTELSVRSANPHMYDSDELTIQPHEVVRFDVPAMGLEGTRTATVRISPMPGLRFGHRLARLIRFPYGCVEQITSAVFPQLYLREFMTMLDRSSGAQHEVRVQVSRNINAGIERLRRFQTIDGGFSYWPGSSSHSQWAANYVGHFLAEAKTLGYFVPSDMLGGWLTYEKKMAAAGTGDLKTRCYRLYLLALAGDPQIGPMNLLREESASVLGNVSTWYLAAAYGLSGMESTALDIIRTADTGVEEYREFGGTYGSALRDKAVLLDLALVLEREDVAFELFSEINTALGTKSYLSTQEGGYCLMAVGKYLKGTWNKDARVAGHLTLEDGSALEQFATVGEPVLIDVTAHAGSTMTLVSQSDDVLYAVLEWEGIPLEGPTEPEAENLELQVEWRTEDGEPTSPDAIEQGTSFWCHLWVTGSLHTGVENVALTQVFPSGWEIENTRLTGEVAPLWARQFSLQRWDYMDVRDDRVMWFFNLGRGQGRDFLVKLSAVTRGTFTLPPTVVEAMYDHDYRALVPGAHVRVTD
jgi:uncharacterized protein YfaS (alpha-2-macroglobulin family)